MRHWHGATQFGGLLIDVFGTQMTAAYSTCGTCGASRPVAELVVYRRAPGTVVRCRTCGSVLMAFVKAHGVICTDMAGLANGLALRSDVVSLRFRGA